MRFLRLTLALITALVPTFAQLGPEQKVQDFRQLAALYAKRYGPALWKKQLLGVDILNIQPWMERVRASKSDLDFIEICYQYVGSFQDVHTGLQMTTNFVADAGIYADIYEGKVLVQFTDPSILPFTIPIRVGDEILAVDGRPANELIDEWSKLIGFGNPLTTRRYVSQFLGWRPQSVLPRAAELPESSTFQILHQTGTTATYTITWEKSGVPITKIGPAPTPDEGKASSGMPRRAAAEEAEDEIPSYLKPMLAHQNWKAKLYNDPRAKRLTEEQQGYLTGLGSKAPVFSLPSNFTIRRGLLASDFHLSATYEAGGKRLGYLRVPSFSPPSTASATAELAGEIAYFQQNTDGLIIDVMRNPGGGCYLQTLASYLIPQPFSGLSETYRVTADYIVDYSNALEAAKASFAEQWVIDYYTFYLELFQKSYAEGRGMTGATPICNLTFENQPAKSSSGAVLAYTKPIIVLIDEFSISAADAFPAIIQDNKRGPIVGTRTAGGGGNISGWVGTTYSEILATNTDGLLLRKGPVTVPDGYPTVPYIENLGVYADVYLNFMTRDNLLQRGRPFLLDFTGAMVSEILKSEGK